MQQDEKDSISKENKEIGDNFMNFIMAIIAFAISVIPLYFAIN